ncbi:hypothetical protein RhiJN_22222 [Ceratobasidium sp. AG-Ba]|nr:hypothetical protein RhiJN_22222 [Ceratobasidium sp. AG-Ba]
MLFALRRISSAANPTASARATDFHATLMFGVFMTLAGVFGLVAESVGASGSRWWFSASYATQSLGVLIAQLAVIQLLTPDYLFRLLSIAAPPNGVPSWRIYALISTSVAASVISLVSAFIIPFAPSLASSIPTFISICLPLPFLLSLAHIVKSARIETQVDPLAATAVHTKRNSKSTEFRLTTCDEAGSSQVTLQFPRIWECALILQCLGALASLCAITEAALGKQVLVLKLLASVTHVIWGGGIMTIHFTIVYEPVHYTSADYATTSIIQHDLERVADQPSEDFMTLRDPFASPTQVGRPLPPSPSAPRRKPRRRASEPLQLTRFGSFSGLHETSEVKDLPELDPDTQFLEALVRHALFSTGFPETSRTSPTADDSCQDVPGRSGTSTPTIRQKRSRELSAPKTPEPGPGFLWHPFRPSTPPRPSRAASRGSLGKFNFPEPPSSFPFSSLSSAESGYSVPMTWSRPSSAYTAPPSPSGGSDSGSSFVSPPPTPTPGPSGSKPTRKVRSLVPTRPAPTLTPVSPRRRDSQPA